ncbi:serine hydrolase domain-containing protein [Streptomyces zhihengii]|uniref:serine hydrolase domain-containing protein n=1 Tax=Streptomyces zhihengii TaxID=1818004 RepID=UPI00363A647D
MSGASVGFGTAVRSAVENAVAEGFSGTVSVVAEGRPVLQGAYGKASRRWDIDNTMDTRFRIASISKAFTAVTVLRLAQDGAVDLDEPLLPHVRHAHPSLDSGITLRHALTMTSGIADWFEEDSETWAADWAALCAAHPLYLLRDNADYLPLFIGKPGHFAPGERYRYNGAGYLLLGLMIEKLTGLDFIEAIQRYVFAPAAMSDAGFMALDSAGPGLAEGYLARADSPAALRTNLYATTPRGAADGGATCTADDLVAFARALRSGTLLNETATRLALTPQVQEREEKIRGYRWMYGFGLTFLLDDNDRVVRWGHTGEEDGASARLYHYPEGDVDIAVLGNVSWSAGDLGWAIHDAVVADR